MAKLNWGMIGGGKGSQIGPAHRLGAQADGNFVLAAGALDIDAEKARLEKGLGKLAKELGGLRGRLNNPKFVASAPDEVVAEAKENLAAREEEEDKIKAALAKLAELD